MVVVVVVTFTQLCHMRRVREPCTHTHAHSRSTVFIMSGKEQAPTVQLQEYLCRHVKAHSSRYGGKRSNSKKYKKGISFTLKSSWVFARQQVLTVVLVYFLLILVIETIIGI